MLTYGERANNEIETNKRVQDKTKNDIRTAMPGIVQSFDPIEQIVTVQLAIQERIRDQNGNQIWTMLPVLLDVPIVFQRAGNFVLTMPVQQGDEVLIIFGDMDFSAWWANGGIQNQEDIRRHDLSDGFAIFAPWSQPRVIPNYNTSAAELRTEDGTHKITLSSSGTSITGGLTVDGIDFGTHLHGGVTGGSGETTGPQEG